MPPYLSPLHLAQPSLPAQCVPANDFLYHLSATFHTCVPTNLAFLSTLLGTCSIVAWLFAQLPQIYKNHQLKSTSGLSLFFLVEWLLGDLSNLVGSIFTRQASWQVILAGYYVIVDCALVGQWIWYELLQHGRPLRSIWKSDSSSGGNPRNRTSNMQEVWESDEDSTDGAKLLKEPVPHGTSRSIPRRSNPMDAFRIPNFARSPNTGNREDTPPLGSTPTRTVHRLRNASSPMPSPKTILYISLIIAVLSNTSTATPLSPFAPGPYPLSARSSSPESSPSATETAGQIISWMSTLLYLGSRLPQLYKNYLRKSTAGLSPTLFLAAFCGNLFYSTSLLTNPCAWTTYLPGEGSGWVGPEGSDASAWILRASPFFLGAAGVLVMDAAVGIQFWYFGDGIDEDEEERGRQIQRDDETILIVNDHGIRKRMHTRWRRASGWMRGWMPSVSIAGTPVSSRASTPSPLDRSPTPTPTERHGRYGSSVGGSDALDEARALLGTSPIRSYGSSGY